MNVDFHVDAITASLIRGWAWLPERPDVALLVELVSSDDEVVAKTGADTFREDLAPAAKRGGWCAFQLRIAPDCQSGFYRLRARLGVETHDLAGPFRHEAEAPVAPPQHGSDRTLGDAAGARGHLDEAGPARFSGWMLGSTPFGPACALDLVADGRVVASAATDIWRPDLEEHNQGNGRVGFRIAIPAALFDGRDHVFDLRWAGHDTSLLDAPVLLRTDAAPPAVEPEPSAIVSRPAADEPIALSVIVNFHDMHREAERTLTSLSRRFQRDIDDIAYEVVCIDNGSSPPMREEQVTRHGPEFRLFRPSVQHPSPVFALNEAAATARGGVLAVMIDGAHLLSPGVVAEAMAAMREDRRTTVAVRHWFIGGDQRWLSTIGYTREHEDLPFTRIGWPDCGYDLFAISAPIFDSPNTWFDAMSESNCLFVSAADFAELGGYDEAFRMPGGEFANLDLFARAARLAEMRVVALIGEATFHQYHDGTTTNVTDAEKERRVRRYAASFEAVRGRRYEAVHRHMLTFRGGIHTDFAMNARQRPSGKVRLGLTPAIRPVAAAHVLDEGAQAYLRGAYVESGAVRASIWAGRPTGVAPADLLEIQQMLWNDRPDVLVLKDVAPGLIGFIRSILPAVMLEGMQAIWLTADADGPTPPGVRRIVGDLADPSIRGRIDAEIGGAEAVCVLFQPRDDETMPVDALHRHAALVSAGGHLVVLGAAFGQPTIGYSSRWTGAAIKRFLEGDRRFVRDHMMNAHVVTTCPSGFLRRLGDHRPGQPYDQNLDALEEFDLA